MLGKNITGQMVHTKHMWHMILWASISSDLFMKHSVRIYIGLSEKIVLLINDLSIQPNLVLPPMGF